VPGRGPLRVWVRRPLRFPLCSRFVSVLISEAPSSPRKRAYRQERQDFCKALSARGGGGAGFFFPPFQGRPRPGRSGQGRGVAGTIVGLGKEFPPWSRTRPSMQVPLLLLPLRRKRDALLARRQARQVASLLRFDPGEQACVAALVFELA